MKDIISDLADRLALLHVRHNVVFGLASLPVDSAAFLTTADVLAEGLRGEDPVAVAKTRGVVDPGDLDRGEFWATPLGRLLFVAGGHGGRSLSPASVAAVLGCSRQWVHELISSGRLKVAGVHPVAVHPEEVQELLRGRLDTFVK